jgi:hypothetical protein
MWVRAGILILAFAVCATADPITKIKIDGKFNDWNSVTSHTDPEGDPHDTDHDQQGDTPVLVDHPDVDILEYKLTHDKKDLYGYWRSKGVIGNTQNQAQGTAGRYYVIITIDVDNKPKTGYWLHEGGYYPTGRGYDMNMECEFYDGAFNTGHYLNHGARNQTELDQAFLDQTQGIVNVRKGSYDYYSQWVWWDEPQGNMDEIVLPDGHSTIIWVEDRGPVYQGIITIALSADGHEAEMKAPFRGFMKNADGKPIIKLGKTIRASFSLEASGELAPGGEWASDTAAPITYTLDKP